VPATAAGLWEDREMADGRCQVGVTSARALIHKPP